MGINHFTKEQTEKLRSNPYVKHVSEKAITYTEEFREEFYIRYQENPFPSKILVEMGFDLHVLGKSRIYNISKRVKAQASRPTGFKDTREDMSGRPRHKERTSDEEIAYLKHQVEYQRQQIEALKKSTLMTRRRHGNKTAREKYESSKK